MSLWLGSVCRFPFVVAAFSETLLGFNLAISRPMAWLLGYSFSFLSSFLSTLPFPSVNPTKANQRCISDLHSGRWCGETLHDSVLLRQMSLINLLVRRPLGGRREEKVREQWSNEEGYQSLDVPLGADRELGTMHTSWLDCVPYFVWPCMAAWRRRFLLQT